MRQRANQTGGFAPHRFWSRNTAPAQLSPTFELQECAEIATTPAYMDDIHAPTVSSGPTSSGYSNGIPKAQLSLQELISEKDRVETELKALGQVLDSVRMQWFSVR
jgi:hypothetical protein